MQPNPPQYPQQPGSPYPQQAGSPYPQQPGAYPQQPGMQPVPYFGPPQKKGFPTWAVLLIVVVCMFPVCGFVGLAAIPLITVNTRDARRIEGEELLVAMKNRVKVAYARTMSRPSTLTGDFDMGGCEVNQSEMEGLYFRVRDSVAHSGPNARLSCNPIENPSDGTGHIDFFLAGEGAQSADRVSWEQAP